MRITRDLGVIEVEELTLTEFLLARIVEDESLARQASAVRKRPWVALAHTAEAWSGDEGHHEVLAYKTASANAGANGFILRTDQAHDAALADYVVSWQPDRVLAECEAKRRIVAEHPHRFNPSDGRLIRESFECERCRETFPEWWCLTLRALALAYASHPDYRPEWAV